MKIHGLDEFPLSPAQRAEVCQSLVDFEGTICGLDRSDDEFQLSYERLHRYLGKLLVSAYMLARPGRAEIDLNQYSPAQVWRQLAGLWRHRHALN